MFAFAPGAGHNVLQAQTLTFESAPAGIKVSVSADGKTLTITHTGSDAQGKPVSGVSVYDRQ
jgi:hypothetical protein